MDNFTCELNLTSEELLFLYQMCKQIDFMPRKLRRKLGEDQFDMICNLTKRLELYVKVYENYLKENKEI